MNLDKFFDQICTMMEECIHILSGRSLMDGWYYKCVIGIILEQLWVSGLHVSQNVLYTDHNDKLHSQFAIQYTCSWQQWTAISEQGVVKINPVDSTQLMKPWNIVGVFNGNNPKCKHDSSTKTCLGANNNSNTIVMTTLEVEAIHN